MNSKGLNITKEQLKERQSSWSYKWTRWFQYTWLGEYWYKIKAGIPSLWKWRKVAWQDRDWDWRHILITMKFKIDNTADYIERYQRSTSWWYDVKWMRTCSKLLDKVGDEYYQHEHFDYKDSELDFVPIEGQDLYEMKTTTVRNELDQYFVKYPLWHKRAVQYIKANGKRYTSDHTDDGLVARVMGKLRHQKAKQLAFKIIETHIEGWWD